MFMFLTGLTVLTPKISLDKIPTKNSNMKIDPSILKNSIEYESKDIAATQNGSLFSFLIKIKYIGTKK
ncbi:hypothetical protein AD951_02285 [Acetobacter malorum]|uniref:Uncharacterized protein n=1 Tax=Acetobacter malorum TaxID=178901 RepID=A0A149URZ3_9PROT|nr:hypothetical protein AD951_02285 [Acetobacter malorum]